MIGSMVVIAAPAAHATTALPDVCGTYLQGTIDPTGGPLPSGIIPLVPPGTTQTYGVFGHLAKGQDKEIINLQQAGVVGTAETKASLSLTWGGTITGNTAMNGPNAPYLTQALGSEPAGGVTSMKLAWKTDKNTGNYTDPTVQVAEGDTAHHKGNIAKGVITGVSGGDNLGAQTGNVQQGAGSPANLDTIDRVVVPQSATSGTYVLSMTIPAIAGPPLGGVTLSSSPIAYNATAAAVKTAIDTGFQTPIPIGPVATVTANANPGDFNIDFGGALAHQGLPLLSAGSQTGTLATTVLDDGSMWNSTLMGGVDPGVSPVSDLGNGILTATGIMSSGVVGGAANVAAVPEFVAPGFPNNGKNLGKSTFVQDTQMTFIQYPAAIVAGIAPHLSPTNPAVPVLAGITGLTATQVGEACGLGGLLAIFCVEDAAVIPATFAGLCGAITA